MSAGSYGASPDRKPGSMNSIERVSIPMRGLCPYPCLPPAQFEENAVVRYVFAESMLNPKAIVNAFAEPVLSHEDRVSRMHKMNACAVCGLCRGTLLRDHSHHGAQGHCRGVLLRSRSLGRRAA